MRVVISGGAGFVGSSLARLFKQQDPATDVYAFDNLRRRGSELNLPAFKREGIQFVHGDVRVQSDLEELPGTFDLFIEASAEPSVHAGLSHGSLRYVLDTNLSGTLNCLEYARKKAAGLVFLSTSRVYSIPLLRSLPLEEQSSRLELSLNGEQQAGLSAEGIAEDFPSVGQGYRSFYGSTKLASELFVEEYAQNFGYPAVINRCGVLAGPGQFGRTDQGVFTLWVARHVFGGKLSYTGFGGGGKQVRDMLHPRDLYSLLMKQLPLLKKHAGEVFAVGGGRAGSVSLLEYTRLCQQVTDNEIQLSSVAETAAVDVPYFVTDSSRAQRVFDWEPTVPPLGIVKEVASWLKENQTSLQALFA